MSKQEESDYKSLYYELLKENQLLQNEIASLKETIGGYKSSNNRYKKANEELKAKLEGSEKSFEGFVKANNEKQNEQKLEIKKLSEMLGEEITRRREAERTMSFYKENYEYFKSLPWYKRIFAK